MRKKLLSLLTVLCLVLGMLPATAMAADIAAELGYSEEEVAMYISEDTELTEDVEGLIIVTHPVKVTVKGATLATGLVVAPGAEGATVTLGENANVNAVIVMAQAEVTVEEKAVATTVTVTAPETKVSVAGEVKAVNVAEEAEKATVTVAETAKVETVEVSAPAAAIEVVGEVKTVAVAETAAGAAVTVAETATVASLEVSAPDVKAEVAGTVESVTVSETATGAELAVTGTAKVAEVTDATGELTVSGEGAGNVTVSETKPAEDEKKDEEPTEDNSNTVVPPLVIEPVEKTAPAGAPQGNLTTAPIGNDNAKNYTVTKTDVTTSYTGDNADAVYNVKISAQSVKETTSSETGVGNNNFKANWVGISIPVDNSGKYSYKVYTLTRWAADKTAADMDAVVFTGESVTNNYWISSDGKVDYTADGGQAYHTVYFPAGSNGNKVPSDTVLWAVGVEVYENAEDSSTAVESAAPVWSEIYNISVDVTLFTEEEQQDNGIATVSEEENDESKPEESPKELMEDVENLDDPSVEKTENPVETPVETPAEIPVENLGESPEGTPEA